MGLFALPVGVHFGWLAANAVSLYAQLQRGGLVAANGAGDLVGIGLLVATAVLAAYLVQEGQRGAVQLWGGFAAAVAWALVGIVANQPRLGSAGTLGAIVAAIPVAVAVLRVVRGPGQRAGASAA